MQGTSTKSTKAHHQNARTNNSKQGVLIIRYTAGSRSSLFFLCFCKDRWMHILLLLASMSIILPSSPLSLPIYRLCYDPFLHIFPPFAYTFPPCFNLYFLLLYNFTRGSLAELS
ncbi:hypothetical protein HDV62DRAFT_370560 [Trichoderma sp. SZMC 28011]